MKLTNLIATATIALLTTAQPAHSNGLTRYMFVGTMNTARESIIKDVKANSEKFSDKQFAAIVNFVKISRVASKGCNNGTISEYECEKMAHQHIKLMTEIGNKVK